MISGGENDKQMKVFRCAIPATTDPFNMMTSKKIVADFRVEKVEQLSPDTNLRSVEDQNEGNGKFDLYVKADDGKIFHLVAKPIPQDRDIFSSILTPFEAKLMKLNILMGKNLEVISDPSQKDPSPISRGVLVYIDESLPGIPCNHCHMQGDIIFSRD